MRVTDAVAEDQSEKLRPRALIVGQAPARAGWAVALESAGLSAEVVPELRDAVEAVVRDPLALLVVASEGGDAETLTLLRLAHARWPDLRTVAVVGAIGPRDVVALFAAGATELADLGDPPERIAEVAARALAYAPGPMPEAKAARRAARRLLDTGAIDEAWGQVRRAVGAEPDSAAAWNLMGLAMALRGQLVSAQRFFRAALALDPTCEAARRNLDRATAGAAAGHGAWDLGEPESEVSEGAAQ